MSSTCPSPPDSVCIPTTRGDGEWGEKEKQAKPSLIPRVLRSQGHLGLIFPPPPRKKSLINLSLNGSEGDLLRQIPTWRGARDQITHAFEETPGLRQLNQTQAVEISAWTWLNLYHPEPVSHCG